MAISPTYPGVYVQEVPSGVRTIAGVSTSTTLFVGAAETGPINAPVLCTSYTEFANAFGTTAIRGDMARYVRLFFLNGGSKCFVMRIANGALASKITLRAEDGTTPVLELSAKSRGVAGETIRAAVTYKGQLPEVTFNLDLFRIDDAGKVTALESWIGLTMDPASATYAPAFLSQSSDLVDAAFPGGTPSAHHGSSRSGRPVAINGGATPGDTDAFDTVWAGLLPSTAADGEGNFRISVDGSEWVSVDLGVVTPTNEAAVRSAFKSAIEGALGLSGITVDVTLVAGPTPASPATETGLLTITSTAHGNVLIRPGTGHDLTAALMLGTAMGGIETGAYAHARPAPTGLTFAPSGPNINTFGSVLQDQVTTLDLDGHPIDLTTAFQTAPPPDLATTPVWRSADPTAVHGGSDGVREKLRGIRDAINNEHAAAPRTFSWQAEVWGSRLAILPTAGEANKTPATFATTATDLAAQFHLNVRWFSLGQSGTGSFQTAGSLGTDGSAPLAADYTAAYAIADEAIDLFNLLVLPPSVGGVALHETLYPEASVFCEKRRAFLLMDSPVAWASAQDVIDGVDGLRIGLVSDHAAVFYPRLVMDENGLHRKVGASGAIAGLCARIDASRGVWKAPAGTEATLRGVIGVTHQLTDSQNGVINPEGVDAIRVFPNGIVSWGARTVDGADAFSSEYKYIPIRRLALFIEESVYRGLAWAVFEGNDNPLWAQIRLNVGAFMHDLFRQGAFQGKTPKDAYFVKCDAETTTQNDRNLGIVNVWVGFAPLRPAEFVVLYLQQMAGQIQAA